jgi:hypothetical protein
MNYLVLRKWRNYEWRLYPDDSKFEGQVIYRGHKMGVDNNLLLEILDIKMVNNNLFEILKYDEGDLNNLRKKVFIKTDKNDLVKTLLESWNSALNKFENQNSNSKRIIVTKFFG